MSFVSVVEARLPLFLREMMISSGSGPDTDDVCEAEQQKHKIVVVIGRLSQGTGAPHGPYTI